MGAKQLSRWFAIVLFAVTCGAAGPVMAQEIYGSVLGAIQDSSGARIPGATVEITGLNEPSARIHKTLSGELAGNG